MRGIERRKIFWDDADRDSFVNRLGQVLIETHTDCFAWALIPNHVHLLMRTGLTPIATVMRRLLTGYAVQFNRLHRHKPKDILRVIDIGKVHLRFDNCRRCALNLSV